MNIVSRKFIFESSLGQSISFGLDQDFVIKKISGIDSNDIDLSTSKSVGQIGESVDYIGIKSKHITIDGFIMNNELSNRYKALDTLIPGDKGKLYCLLENGERVYIDVIVKKSPAIQNTNYKPNFQLELSAPYPFWKSVTSEKVIVNGLIPMFRYPRNTGAPSSWKFSKYTEGELTYITNHGNYDVGMKITIKAKNTISGFKLQEANTLKYIALKQGYEMQQDEIVTITTGYNNKRVESSINGNIFKYLDLDSDFLQLKPGVNTFKFTLQQSKTLAEVNIEYENIKVGI